MLNNETSGKLPAGGNRGLPLGGRRRWGQRRIRIGPGGSHGVRLCRCGQRFAGHDGYRSGRKTAIVVKQKNSDEIAAAVIRLSTNPALSSAMAREGRRQVLESFDWQAIVPKYRVVLNTTIKAAGPG